MDPSRRQSEPHRSTTVYQMTPTQLAANPVRARIVDVRQSDEVASGAIAGSTNIPLLDLPARVVELDRAIPIVTVCRSGRRSQEAAEVLQTAGFTVANLEGGIDRWTSEGHTTI